MSSTNNTNSSHYNGVTTHFKLVINADDVGYSHTRDEGISECIKTGSVTSGSLLVNGISAKSVILTRHPEISLGLHLNLTEGSPIGSSYDTLTDERGYFRGKFGFREAISSGQINLDEISEEVDLQIQAFSELADRKPSHIDGHQHIHVIPDVMKILATHMVSNAINITRIPYERHLESCSLLSGPSRMFFQSVTQDSLQSRVICRKNGIQFTDAFVGLSTMGHNLTEKNLLERIRTQLDSLEDKRQSNSPNSNKTAASSREPWNFELMVHPGYLTGDVGGCGAGPDEFSQSTERQHELNVLKELMASKFYLKHRIELTSFDKLFK
ncbi:carbohydrate deacetylase-like isoform X1 [Argonauta hians]